MNKNMKNIQIADDIVIGEDSIVGEIKIELIENLLGGTDI